MLRKERRTRKHRFYYIAISVLIFIIGIFLTARSFLSGQPFTEATISIASVTQVDVNEPPQPTTRLGPGEFTTPTASASGQTPIASATLIGMATVGDGWANAILERVLSQFKGGQTVTGSGFPWWQSSTAAEQLTFHDGLPFLGQDVLALPSDKDIVLSVPDAQDPDRLHQIGLIQVEAGALTLIAFDQNSLDNEIDWIIGKSDFAIPFHALVVQAAAQNAIIRLAVNISDSLHTEVVVTGIDSYVVLETPQPPSLQITPIPQQSPTSTRIPEVAMGRMVANYLDPVIDALPEIKKESIDNYVRTHSFSGLLMWTEKGPEINGHRLSVGQAEEMKLNSLVPGGDSGEHYTFLTAQYAGSVTRILEAQIYYQEQRMEELIYWAIVHAAERGGQLKVSYDDFGSQQAITIIGFQMFQQP